MRGWIILMVCSLGLGQVTVGWSQVHYFGCAEVRFFGAGCPPAPEARAAEQDEEEHRAFLALFPPGTMSPYTPPLLVHLLAEPTPENAQRYLAWQQAQLARIQAVQALLRQVQMEQAQLQGQGPPPCQSCPVGRVSEEAAGRK